MNAPLTSGALTSFPGTGAEFSQPCPVGEERRWNWNRRAQPHLLSPPAVKAPRNSERGAAARPGLRERRRPGHWCAGKVPLLDGASLLPSPGRTQKGNARQCCTGSRVGLPSAAGMGWRAGPWLCGVGEQGHGCHSELRVPPILGSEMGLPAGAGETLLGNYLKFVGEWVYFMYKHQRERRVRVEGEDSSLKRKL